jgi:hypothetical protein
MRKFWLSPNIVLNGILWLVALAVQIGGGVSHTVAYVLFGIAFIWSLCTLAYWWTRKGKKQLETTRGVEAGNLTDILPDMHRRMWKLKGVRLRQRFNAKKFEDGAPLLFDSLGLVELKDWDNFEKRLKRKLKRRIPKSPEKRRSMVWRYKMVGEAKEIVRELVNSKQWQIPEDGLIIGKHLDSLGLGLGELRDQDKQWQDLSKKVAPHTIDAVLRELIDKYKSCSYAFCSISLGIDYGRRLPKNSISELYYSALVGGKVSPDEMETALGEILQKINDRQKVLKAE